MPAVVSVPAVSSRSRHDQQERGDRGIYRMGRAQRNPSKTMPRRSRWVTLLPALQITTTGDRMTIAVIVDWSGPFPTIERAKNATREQDLAEVLYLAVGKRAYQREAD